MTKELMAGCELLFVVSFMYIANRLIYVLHSVPLLNYFIYALFLFFAIISIITFIGRRRNDTYINFITPLAYAALGAWTIFITYSAINELLNLIMLLLKVHGFRYYSTLICLALCAIFSLWSFINAKFIIRIKRIYIKLRSAETGSATIGTPRLTIAAISDIHISESTKPKTIRALFNKVALLNADIIVIVGDLIDTNILNNICASDDCSDYGFDLLKAKYGVYAVSGNHDYYTGLRVFIKLCEKYNITVLNNTSTLVSAGANSVGSANHGGANGIINIAGIHDSNWKRPKVIRNAICGSDKNYPVLFLSHRPEAFRTAKEIDEYNIIQVSGHTHVGQVPPIEIARSFMKYNYGLYKCNGNTMYVSSGARFWGPPVRFASMGEIALITLDNSGCRSSSG